MFVRECTFITEHILDLADCFLLDKWENGFRLKACSDSEEVIKAETTLEARKGIPFCRSKRKLDREVFEQ